MIDMTPVLIVMMNHLPSVSAISKACDESLNLRGSEVPDNSSETMIFRVMFNVSHFALPVICRYSTAAANRVRPF